MRLDDAVLAASSRSTKPPPKANARADPIPVSDTAGVRSLFRGLATLKRQQFKKGEADG